MATGWPLNSDPFFTPLHFKGKSAQPNDTDKVWFAMSTAASGARSNLDPMAFVAKSFTLAGDLDTVDNVVQQVQATLKHLDLEISADVRKTKSFAVNMVR